MNRSPESNTEAPATGAPDRWTLIRDIAVLQFKLVLDGIRDVVLVPVSLLVGAISLFKGGDRPGAAFYGLLRYGRQTDRVINLFGAADRVQAHRHDDGTLPDIDDLVSRVESFVVDEYQRGGMTAQAKDRIDSVLDAINRRIDTPRGAATDGS